MRHAARHFARLLLESDADNVIYSTVFIPIFGESASVFGRRWPTIFSVATFVLGSGIAGGATSTAMLIGMSPADRICSVSLTPKTAGRAVQGIGGAGVSVFGNVIVSDLTSVRERSKYMAIVFASLGIGLALGPPVGGIMAEHDWRWVFVRIFTSVVTLRTIALGTVVDMKRKVGLLTISNASASG